MLRLRRDGEFHYVASARIRGQPGRGTFAPVSRSWPRDASSVAGASPSKAACPHPRRGWPIRNTPTGEPRRKRRLPHRPRRAADARRQADRRLRHWRAASVGPFTDEQIELVETFADQAVIAIENVAAVRGGAGAHARSSAKRCEQQTATATCSRSSAARPSICSRCSTRSLESAARLCEADMAAHHALQRGRQVSTTPRSYGLPIELAR